MSAVLAFLRIVSAYELTLSDLSQVVRARRLPPQVISSAINCDLIAMRRIGNQSVVQLSIKGEETVYLTTLN